MTIATKIIQNKYWKASLSLCLTRKLSKSVLTKCHHNGPLRIQRPFYPESDLCPHLYILHPPGGFVAGDDVQINVHAQNNAQCLLTTPAAGKFYGAKTLEQTQLQKTTLILDEQSCIEYLPQETIVFDSAKANNFCDIHLHKSATLFYWDTFCLGRLKSGEHFSTGYINQNVRIFCDDQLIHIERNQLNAQSELFKSPAGFSNYPVFGTFYAYSEIFLNKENSVLIENLEKKLFEIQKNEDFYIALTQKNGLLIARYLGNNAAHAQTLFKQVWETLRPIAKNTPACPPRIWNT
ncbi:urease accessory protein UreD [Marinicellulosiphila megalodicopiae]|uniref:urease accessory protein UreD n=1 Tax=Marinicellulosiphila megalodicopiae TaxID=2724896 RepID=UPI003BB13218